jgi:cytochrome c biogenesis protein CcmG, thiol:disulfide interchange protein DsbE
LAAVWRNLEIAVLVAVLALVAGGCGSAEEGGDYGGQHPDYAKAFAGAPAPLAALYRQSNHLLPGGKDAFEARVAALHGYPVVANVWASWCGACRLEFPIFQKVSAAFGKRVAFLGIDSEDSDDTAATFLEEAPVPYPSYTDPNEDIASEFGLRRGYPDTAFYTRDGQLCFVKQGPYTDPALLEADVKSIAIRERGCEGG